MTSEVVTCDTPSLSVSVRADGSLVGLRIAKGAMAVSGELLASSILALVARARLESAEKMRSASAALNSDPRIVAAMEKIAESVDQTEPQNDSEKNLQQPRYEMPTSYLRSPM
ncbi:hypothetical protein [Rhodococcus sp. ARC_M6]|uniref:hypothetical protein n=1 Tax=Rhodococcus sp. ARC_M6 TaxID=2928852 RepID=UPI001FB44C78|nr:hypothetical protein [Rhodococcus sp. ARC_M6]MCJ0907192.1 hypothetical protein [Rhodococcus sp. ARC_M6]